MEIAVLIIGLLMTGFGAYLMLCGMCYPEMVSQTQGGFKSREELERTKTKAFHILNFGFVFSVVSLLATGFTMEMIQNHRSDKRMIMEMGGMKPMQVRVVEREKGVAAFKYDGEFASIETDGFFVLCMKKRDYSFWQSRLWFKAFDATKYKLEKTETVLAKH